VRFSHPNYPEDWATNHYIDIDVGRDGAQITGLAPVGDRLLVFTEVAVYAITGYDANTFQQFEVSRYCGAVSQEAIAITEYGVYFFSWPDGVFLYTGEKPRWIFRNLQTITQDGSIPSTYQGTICLGWLRRRLWVSVPWNSSATPTRVFVLDPAIANKKDSPGSWMAYSLAVGPMVTWRKPAADPIHLACHPTAKRVIKLHQSAHTDDIGTGDTAFESYYRTRWFDVNSSAVFKRWKRPEIILDAEEDVTLNVEAYHDYNPTIVRRASTLVLDVSTNALVWDDGSHAATMKWDDNVWGADLTGSTAQQVKRVATLGRARAISLKFTLITPTTAHWAINAINLKYVPKKVRN
jgi:hypothetical protein